jgi:hypothetical protein
VAALLQRSGQPVQLAKGQGRLDARRAAYVQAFLELRRHVPHANITSVSQK